ncbi:MAG TPA: hypothetical protein VF306_20735, partial [Pirellulales bacterium]
MCRGIAPRWGLRLVCGTATPGLRPGLWNHAASRLRRAILPRLAAALLIYGGACIDTVRGDATAEPSPATHTDNAIIYFANGDQLPGRLADGERDGLGWQSSAFAGPFSFNVAALDVVRFALPPAEAWDESHFRIELPDGDAIHGRLISLGPEELVVETRHGGQLRLRRSAVRRLDRRGGNSTLIYQGPNGVGEWRTNGADLWQEEQGSLITTRESATLERDFALPAKAAIEFEVSWGLWVSPHDFSIALGTTVGARELAACSFEIVDGQLLLVRETGHDVDVARVLKLEAGAGRVHLQVFLDQDAQKVDVFSADGRPLASVQTSADPARVQTGISIAHAHGGLRLDKLRVSRWNGSPPTDLASGQPHLQRTDGTPVAGELVGYDAQRRQFSIRDGQSVV